MIKINENIIRMPLNFNTHIKYLYTILIPAYMSLEFPEIQNGNLRTEFLKRCLHLIRYMFIQSGRLEISYDNIFDCECAYLNSKRAIEAVLDLDIKDNGEFSIKDLDYYNTKTAPELLDRIIFRDAIKLSINELLPLIMEHLLKVTLDSECIAVKNRILQYLDLIDNITGYYGTDDSKENKRIFNSAINIRTSILAKELTVFCDENNEKFSHTFSLAEDTFSVVNEDGKLIFVQSKNKANYSK